MPTVRMYLPSQNIRASIPRSTAALTTPSIPVQGSGSWASTFNFKSLHMHKIFCFFFFITGLASCTKDLNRQPLNSKTTNTQYSTPAGYKQALAKVYGSYSLVSSSGTGVSDVNVAGISDPGTTDFVRAYWNMQELTTDEDGCAWNDGALQNFHNFSWTSSNVYITA